MDHFLRFKLLNSNIYLFIFFFFIFFLGGGVQKSEYEDFADDFG